MSHRPYPNRKRALHQLDRHVKTTPALPEHERFARGLAALRGAGWTAQGLATAWQAALRPRPAGSEETSA